MSTRRRLLSAVTLAVLSACSGGGDGPSVLTEDAAPATTEALTTVAPTTTVAPAKASDVAKRYFEAFATNRPTTMQPMVAASAPDSAAFTYARFQIASTQARADQALTNPPAEMQVSGDIIRMCVPSTVRTIPGTDRCSTFGDFTASAGTNLLTNFTVNGTPISERLVRGGATATARGVKFTLVAGYQSVQTGILNLVVEVANGPVKASVYSDSAVYVGATGRQVKATDAVAPFEVQPSASALVLLNFADAAPGGRLVLKGYDGAALEVTIPLS